MNAEKTGGFIRDLRKEKNLTQQALAELLSVSDKAVSRWETGRGFPDISSLEDIADVLDVSVAELLRGERFGADISEDDMEEVSSASFSIARTFAKKKKWQNLAIGFVSGMIILLLLVIHLTSPVRIKNAENALSIDMLSDDEIVAVMNENVSGYEINSFTDPDAHSVYKSISCYDTLWNRFFGNKSKTIVSLGQKDSMDYICYYPSDEGDQLIWKNDALSEAPGSVVTLPRLIYNYWILIGMILSAAGLVLCVIFRKKYFIDRLIKITLIPAAFTLSTAAVTAGSSGEIYNAAYYLSGILLLAVLLYVLFTLIYGALRKKHKKNSNKSACEG